MKIELPEGFLIGASSSAWQTEGWKGKKPGQDSYLDSWYLHEPNVWHEGYGPAVATDFMERYQEDVDLMKEIGLQAYRTSINWARFFTDYDGLVVDEDYARHIDEVVDALVAAGVEPMLCLEHYEVPQTLIDEYGGWSSRHVADLFEGFARIAFDRYGDRVHQWFTFNEPIVPQTRCYLDAVRWPHEQDARTWMAWNYHKALASALAVRAFREVGHAGRIGCVLNPEITYARSSSPADLRARDMYDLFFNRVFLDPMVRGSYPEELEAICRTHGIWPEMAAEDLETIAENTVDFLGINLYYPKRVKAQRFAWNTETPFHPEMFYESFDLPGKTMNTSRGWEIYPKAMYDMAMYLKDNYGEVPWIVSENGIGIEGEERFMDGAGTVQDRYRIDFIAQHLRYLVDAVKDGARCEGYMLWAFTDNVSPMNAFKNRYGLVRIELDDQRTRRMKASGFWYRDLIADRSFLVTDVPFPR